MFWSFNRSKANEELSYVEMNTDHNSNDSYNDDDEVVESQIYDYEVDRMKDPHQKNTTFTSSTTQDIQKILNRPKITELKTEFLGDVPDYMKRFSSGKKKKNKKNWKKNCFSVLNIY